MRYDTKITFFKEKQGKYNPITSKHDHKVVSWSKYANVTDVATLKQVELLGEIKQGSKIIRLPSKKNAEWDYLTIMDNSTKYRFVSSMEVLKGYAMLVGQDNG